MYSYIKGIIDEVTSSSVVIDNNGIGYNVVVSNPYSFNVGEEYKVYLYNYIREDEYSLYGFKSLEEKDLFLRLINVKGLGPKIALPMLATGSVNGIVDAIDRENIMYLTKFPKVGDKLARQIILDLKGKLVMTKEEVKVNDELVDVLIGLGYKNGDINKIIKDIDNTKPIGEQIKDALKLLLKK